MPNWNEKEFIERAKSLAKAHVGGERTINDLTEKMARDHALGPDEIRTLVRMTNVQVFGEKFASMDGGDKMVSFEVGEPEQVIQRIIDSVASPPVESANVHNDPHADSIPDYMQEVRLGGQFDGPAEKVASLTDEESVKAPSRESFILSSRKLAEDLHIEQTISGLAWEDSIKAAHDNVRRSYDFGQKLASLEVDAFATHGEEIRAEVNALRSELRLPESAITSEKVAHLQEHHQPRESKELGLLKEAYDARLNYTKFQKATAWLRGQSK